MFRLTPNPTFTADVKVTVPGADAQAVLTLTFRHKGRKALKAWIEGAAERPDAEFLDEVIESWRGVETATGAVAYSRETLAELLDAYPAAGGEIFDAYLRALTRAREKN